jgi:hypothetical protein
MLTVNKSFARLYGRNYSHLTHLYSVYCAILKIKLCPVNIHFFGHLALSLCALAEICGMHRLEWNVGESANLCQLIRGRGEYNFV